MDNTTLIYNAIQRVYRTAVVSLVRKHMGAKYGTMGPQHLASLYSKDIGTGQTQWQAMRAAAHERRSGGTEELSTPIADEYELIGVEHFYTVFEKHFDVLCPQHADKDKENKAKARQSLLGWMKLIKNVRDPVSHPVTDDLSYDDSSHALHCARKVLEFCRLSGDAGRVRALQSRVLGGFTAAEAVILTGMPPASEVVTGFVGRHEELASLHRWIEQGSSARWALSGEGGKGKSAIAYAFATSVSQRNDHKLDAVLWLSAKRRRFVEGRAVQISRPDFHDKASAAAAVLGLFGEEASTSPAEDANRCLTFLNDFPTLIVADDIDSVDPSGEDAIQFLLMAIPERTRSKVLITSRLAQFGMANLTTTVSGLNRQDAHDFITSRCDMMGIHSGDILANAEAIVNATDSSPLYIEDLLRLTQAGLDIGRAVELWSDKRGAAARSYALQKEYDQLGDDAKQFLLALSVQGLCTVDHLCRGLAWGEERVLDAMQELRTMFLMPRLESSSRGNVIALNTNTRTLVIDVFSNTEAYRRTTRLMSAAAGSLTTKREEERRVAQALGRARIRASSGEVVAAEADLRALLAAFPGRADIHANLGWMQKRHGEVATARMNFLRADELGCSDRDAYWHWSNMEADEQEWPASARAAELGLHKFKDDQGLAFRHGYALHRQGRELVLDGDVELGEALCRRAQSILMRALDLRSSEDRNFTLRGQIFRAILLNLDALGDKESALRHLDRWRRDVPDDLHRSTDEKMLRRHHPDWFRE